MRIFNTGSPLTRLYANLGQAEPRPIKAFWTIPDFSGGLAVTFMHKLVDLCQIEGAMIAEGYYGLLGPYKALDAGRATERVRALLNRTKAHKRSATESEKAQHPKR